MPSSVLPRPSSGPSSIPSVVSPSILESVNRSGSRCCSLRSTFYGVRDMGVEKVHDFPALRQNAHFLLSFESTHFVFRFWHWRHARSDGVALLFRMALISERNVAYMMKAHQIAEHRGKRQEPKSSRRSRPITRNTGKTDPPRNNLNRLRKYIGTVPDGSLNFNKHTTGICRRCLVDRLFPEGAVCSSMNG
ncbi:hypothetical protein KC348_g8 [Hortaea werneckii]|nr:hypothetical protein KC348_g8 [Hortaea werneckii]